MMETMVASKVTDTVRTQGLTDWLWDSGYSQLSGLLGSLGC